MFYIRLIFQLLFGIVFIVSAYLKLAGFNAFEIYVYRLELFTWNWSANLAWLLILFEFVIGTAIILQIKTKLSLALANIALVGFSIWLTVDLVLHGNAENCHCFGNTIQFDTYQSLLKNIALLFLGIPLFLSPVLYTYSYRRILGILVVGSIAIWQVVVRPPNIIKEDIMERALVQKKVLPIEYFDEAEFIGANPDLRKGKHLIGFLMQKCSHCKLSASRLAVLKKKYPSLPAYLVFIEGGFEKETFWNETGASEVPYVLMDRNHFVRTAGVRYPIYFYIEDGKMIHQFGMPSINDELVNTYFEEYK